MSTEHKTGTQHIAVMLHEVLEYLNAQAGGSFLDCTLGGAGHTQAILNANPQNKVLALDRDQRAIERAREFLKNQAERVEFSHLPFSQLLQVCASRQFDGVLADLGISTDQLRESRGFSFCDESSLDMRMDESQVYSADTLVNQSSEQELYAILKRGGVGREANAVVRAILKARPIKNTKELANIVIGAARGLSTKTKINPATVVFQAIRIAVNGELDEIEGLLNAVPQIAKAGMRFAVITFHSLEDKLVTRRMRDWEGGSTAPAWWPQARAVGKSLGRMVERKAITAGEEEIEANPSSRSARLRVFEFS